MQSMKWNFMAPCVFPKYVYTLYGDSGWNFNARVDNVKGKVGTLLAWMEIAELSLCFWEERAGAEQVVVLGPGLLQGREEASSEAMC